MPFGAHEGKEITALPLDYIRWCVRNFQPSPLVTEMIRVVKERGKATRSTIYLSINKKPEPIKKIERVHTIGEPFGKLKEELENAPEGLF